MSNFLENFNVEIDFFFLKIYEKTATVLRRR